MPYDYPHLSQKSVVTSPFTLVFARAGSKAAGSFMNAVILSSVVSAGNHALFAGSRVLYSLAQPLPSSGNHPKYVPVTCTCDLSLTNMEVRLAASPRPSLHARQRRVSRCQLCSRLPLSRLCVSAQAGLAQAICGGGCKISSESRIRQVPRPCSHMSRPIIEVPCV